MLLQKKRHTRKEQARNLVHNTIAAVQNTALFRQSTIRRYQKLDPRTKRTYARPAHKLNRFIPPPRENIQVCDKKARYQPVSKVAQKVSAALLSLAALMHHLPLHLSTLLGRYLLLHRAHVLHILHWLHGSLHCHLLRLHVLLRLLLHSLVAVHRDHVGSSRVVARLLVMPWLAHSSISHIGQLATLCGCLPLPLLLLLLHLLLPHFLLL